MKLRRKTSILKTILAETLLVFLCMYAANPFIIQDVEYFNRTIYYAFCFVPIILALINIKRNLKIGDEERLVLYVLCYVVVAFMISQQGDITYVVYLMRLLLRMLGMITVVLIWRSLYLKKIVSCEFGMVYIYSILLYMCSTFYFILNPDAKMNWNDLIVSYQEEYLLEWTRFTTRFGFAGWSDFSFSVWVTIGLIYLYYMYLNKKIKFIKFFVLSLFCMVGATIYARSGSILSFLVIIVVVFNELRKRKTKYLRYLLVGSIFIVFIISLISKYNEDSHETLDWMFEFINNMGKSGSSEELSLMYKNFSPSLKTLLIGDGKWNMTDGGYYGSVDVGFLRNLLYGGVLYSLFEYGIGVFFVLMMRKKLRRFNLKGSNVLPFLVFLILLFCELKGDLLFYNLKMLIPFVFIIRIEGICENVDLIRKPSMLTRRPTYEK